MSHATHNDPDDEPSLYAVRKFNGFFCAQADPAGRLTKQEAEARARRLNDRRTGVLDTMVATE